MAEFEYGVDSFYQELVNQSDIDWLSNSDLGHKRSSEDKEEKSERVVEKKKKISIECPAKAGVKPSDISEQRKKTKCSEKASFKLLDFDISCMVLGCRFRLHNKSKSRAQQRYEKRKKKAVRFFQLPSPDQTQEKSRQELIAVRRKHWLSAVKQEELLDETVQSFVCSRHFVSGSAAEDLNCKNVDWVPTLDLGHHLKISRPKMFKHADDQKDTEKNVLKMISRPREFKHTDDHKDPGKNALKISPHFLSRTSKKSTQGITSEQQQSSNRNNTKLVNQSCDFLSCLLDNIEENYVIVTTALQSFHRNNQSSMHTQKMNALQSANSKTLTTHKNKQSDKIDFRTVDDIITSLFPSFYRNKQTLIYTQKLNALQSSNEKTLTSHKILFPTKDLPPLIFNQQSDNIGTPIEDYIITSLFPSKQQFQTNPYCSQLENKSSLRSTAPHETEMIEDNINSTLSPDEHLFQTIPKYENRSSLSVFAPSLTEDENGIETPLFQTTQIHNQQKNNPIPNLTEPIQTEDIKNVSSVLVPIELVPRQLAIGRQQNFMWGEEPFVPVTFSPAHKFKARWTRKCEKSFKCEYCPAEFLSSLRLLEHRSVHTRKKPFKCDLCQKSLRGFFHLKTHLKAHAGEKSHLCELCGNCFISKSNLLSHRRTHYRVRRYKCKFCPAAFKWLLSWKNHLKLHAGDLPFKCQLCSACYRTQTQLNIHIAMHKEETLQCDWNIFQKRFSKKIQ